MVKIFKDMTDEQEDEIFSKILRNMQKYYPPAYGDSWNVLDIMKATVGGFLEVCETHKLGMKGVGYKTTIATRGKDKVADSSLSPSANILARIEWLEEQVRQLNNKGDE